MIQGKASETNVAREEKKSASKGEGESTCILGAVFLKSLLWGMGVNGGLYPRHNVNFS